MIERRFFGAAALGAAGLFRDAAAQPAGAAGRRLAAVA